MPVLFLFILLIIFQATDHALGNFPCVLWLRLAGVLSEEQITVAY